MARETQDYAQSQRQAINIQEKSHNFKHSIEFAYSDFLCHFKVNRYKLALINRRLTAGSLTKIDQVSVSRRYRYRDQRWGNPDRAKNQSDCRIRYPALLEENT